MSRSSRNDYEKSRENLRDWTMEQLEIVLRRPMEWLPISRGAFVDAARDELGERLNREAIHLSTDYDS
jgi:hypothetical protein